MATQLARGFFVLLVAVAALAAACGGESDASPEEQNCSDRKDDDRDGLFDCNDPDCADVAVCVREHCYNLVDDDGDGAVDCQDSQCEGRSVCTTATEDCVNGRDDDGDGETDCDDDKCESTFACVPDGENCTNGIDDDGDGDADCDDTDCSKTAVCAVVLEHCDDGVDNDADGDVDCDDDDCSGTSVCLEAGEVCNDGADNDGDGDADCADLNCAYTASCGLQSEACDNDIDDDGDGAVDCDDPACDGSSACARVCVEDTDEDGTPDCRDGDIDGDGIDNADDNCPLVDNPSQDNRTNDDVGDACDDTDLDGVADAVDNCWLSPNAGQRDRDQDGNGNACDDQESLDAADAVFAMSGALATAADPVAVGELDGQPGDDVLFSGRFEAGMFLFGGLGSNPFPVLEGTDAVISESDPLGNGSYLYVRSGDFNGDGVLDLVYGQDKSGGSFLYVLLGPFQPEAVNGETTPLEASNATLRITVQGVDFLDLDTISVGDLNGDGRDDLAIGFPELDRVRVVSGVRLSDQDAPDINASDAQWDFASPVPGDAFGARVEFMPDFLPLGPTNSGGQELAVLAGGGIGTVRVLEAETLISGDSVFAATFTRILDDGYDVRVSPDTNSDGLPAFVATNIPCNSSLGGMGLLELPGTPSQVIYPDGFAVISCRDGVLPEVRSEHVFLDFDGDGTPGLLVVRETQFGFQLAYYRTWQNAQAGPDAPQRAISTATPSTGPRLYPIGDVDGNGHPDLLIGSESEGPHDVSLWLWP